MTNRHVVADIMRSANSNKILWKKSCRRNMTVKSWFGQPVAVTKWFVSHDDDIDLALGLLEDDAGLPLLNISSASDIIQGMELSAVCIRNSVKVALPAKVIYVDGNRSHA